MSFCDDAKVLGDILHAEVRHCWDGRECIAEMKSANYPHWRQMEWIGFYFQFCCEKFLRNKMEMPGRRYGNTTFDGHKHIPWDFKAHVINASTHDIIVNDVDAIIAAIEDYGSVGLILAVGEAIFNDENGSFKRWHDIQKGGTSQYEIERIKRGARSRRRKTAYTLREIKFLEITTNTIKNCGQFQKNFRNADGSPRNPKILMKPDIVENATGHIVYFP